MSALEAVLDRLAERGCSPKASGGSWAAQCPAHDDRAPSLAVKAATNTAGALVKCHAGCSLEDVLAALDLRTADLFDDAGDKRRGFVVVAEYPYTDEAGTVLFIKERRFPKDFRQRTPDGQWSLDGVRRVLYRLPEVAAAIADGRTVYVVEGEKDADRLASLGLTATCNAEGAAKDGQRPKWRPEYTDTLAGAHVVIVADKDGPGRAHAAAILQALSGRAASLRVVQAVAGKDVSDHLDAGHDVDDLEPLDLAGQGRGEIPHAEPSKLDSRPGDHGKGGPTASTVLVQLGREAYRLGATQEGEPFAVPKLGPNVARLLRGDKGSLRAELAATYFQMTGRVAPQQALADALLTLQGECQNMPPEQLHLRVAEHRGELWLDLGDGSGQAVQITPDDWSVRTAAPVLFRRTGLTAALPVPERGGTLAELWDLLNVTEADRPLVAAWLVAALFPAIPHPILAVRGEQGAGKSTASRMLVGILDPSPAALRKPPRDVDGWVTAAAGSWVVGVDNVSTVAEWWSDALCRAVTGDGDVRRQLYTDAGLTVFAFRRVVLLNGIDLGAVRDDLAERLLTVELHRIDESTRRLDADLAQAWEQAHPRIVGALLDLASKVLAELPRLKLDRLPRMADFARVLHAVDAAMGTDGASRYAGQAGDLAADAVDADPVLTAITRAIREPWTGTAAQLLDLITPHDDPAWRRPREWPKDGRSMTAHLRRRSPSLRRLGWLVEDLGRGGKTVVLRFRIEPPAAPEQAGIKAGMRQASGSDAGDACPMPAPDACLSAPALTCGNGESDAEAGMAGIDPGLSLCPPDKEEEGGGAAAAGSGAPLEGSHPMPAMPAMPAGGRTPSFRDAFADDRADDVDLHHCAECGRPVQPSRRALEMRQPTVCNACCGIGEEAAS